MRLADKIACYGIKAANRETPATALEKIATQVLTARTINIDNVSDYVGATNKTFDVSDIPNAAPPFREMFFEWTQRDAPTETASLHGVYMSAASFAELRVKGVKSLEPHVIGEKDLLSDGWAIMAHMFADVDGKKPTLLPFQLLLRVGATGEIPDNGIQVAIPDKYGVNPELIQTLRNIASSTMMLALLAISFMHCRNVSLKEGAIPEPLRKKHKKLHGVPRVKYHVLEIAPMRQVLRKAVVDANAAGETNVNPLHICRGHFKDYRQSGLFGKVKGIFWWDQYMRGSAENGQVLKDYEIKTRSDVA